MKLYKTWIDIILMIIFFPFILGCGVTAISKSHPLIAKKSNPEAALVYFMRTDPGFRGVMGNAFSIILNKKELLTLAKGEYTLVHLKPFSGGLTVRSDTVVSIGGRNTMTKVSETSPVNFSAGKLHYILFMENRRGPFRGSTFVPVKISRNRAVRIANQLKPIGNALRFPLRHTSESGGVKSDP